MRPDSPDQPADNRHDTGNAHFGDAANQRVPLGKLETLLSDQLAHHRRVVWWSALALIALLAGAAFIGRATYSAVVGAPSAAAATAQHDEHNETPVEDPEGAGSTRRSDHIWALVVVFAVVLSFIGAFLIGFWRLLIAGLTDLRVTSERTQRLVYALSLEQRDSAFTAQMVAIFAYGERYSDAPRILPKRT